MLRWWINRYLSVITVANLQLLLAGGAAGAMFGLARARVNTHRWGAGVVAGAAIWAAFITGHWERPADLSWTIVLAVVVIGLASVGTAQVAARDRAGRWLGAGVLVSLGGVFVAVPENRPAVVAGGVIAGLWLTAVTGRSTLGPAAGGALALLTGWAALSGAYRPTAIIGGALCTGLAPWLGLRHLLPVPQFGLPAGPWLLVAHCALVLAAGRWIGSAPDATWGRVAIMAALGAVVALAVRWRP